MNPGSLQHMIPPLSGSASEKHSYNPVWWILFSATEATGALRREGYVAAPDSQLGSGGLFHISSGRPSHNSQLLTPPHRSPHPKGKCWASAQRVPCDMGTPPPWPQRCLVSGETGLFQACPWRAWPWKRGWSLGTPISGCCIPGQV